MSSSYENRKARVARGSGRNAEKRAARKAEAELRAQAVAARAAGDFTVNTAKIRRSRLMVNMLANRRLRQRGLAR